MKVCPRSGSRPSKTRERCRHCSKAFPSSGSFTRHQLRDHQDTWAVIDMMEAGLSDQEAGRLYDKTIKQGVKSFGSFYTRTKARQRKMKHEKSEKIKMEEIESSEDGGDSSWIIDDNINYDSDSDEQHREEDKRSSQGGH